MGDERETEADVEVEGGVRAVVGLLAAMCCVGSGCYSSPTLRASRAALPTTTSNGMRTRTTASGDVERALRRYFCKWIFLLTITEGYSHTGMSTQSVQMASEFQSG